MHITIHIMNTLPLLLQSMHHWILMLENQLCKEAITEIPFQHSSNLKVKRKKSKQNETTNSNTSQQSHPTWRNLHNKNHRHHLQTEQNMCTQITHLYKAQTRGANPKTGHERTNKRWDVQLCRRHQKRWTANENEWNGSGFQYCFFAAHMYILATAATIFTVKANRVVEVIKHVMYMPMVQRNDQPQEKA